MKKVHSELAWLWWPVCMCPSNNINASDMFVSLWSCETDWRSERKYFHSRTQYEYEAAECIITCDRQCHICLDTDNAFRMPLCLYHLKHRRRVRSLLASAHRAFEQRTAGHYLVDAQLARGQKLVTIRTIGGGGSEIHSEIIHSNSLPHTHTHIAHENRWTKSRRSQFESSSLPRRWLRTFIVNSQLHKFTHFFFSFWFQMQWTISGLQSVRQLKCSSVRMAMWWWPTNDCSSCSWSGIRYLNAQSKCFPRFPFILSSLCEVLSLGMSFYSENGCGDRHRFARERKTNDARQEWSNAQVNARRWRLKYDGLMQHICEAFV